jgi:hypothetical protein
VTRAAKLGVAAVIAAVLGATAATIAIAARVGEETVVASPYEEGLRHDAARARHAPGAPCDLRASACTLPLGGGGTVTLELSPRPLRTMRELAVRAEVRGAAGDEGAAVLVSFEMEGMRMGENVARLAPAGNGRHEGRAVLVRCPSGRRDWTAALRVERAGVPPSAALFRFTVEE